MMLEKIAIVAGLGLALSTAVEAQTPRHSHDGALLELKETLGLSYIMIRVVATPKPYFSARPCRRWKRDPTGTRYGAGERMRLPALHFRRHEPIRETSRLRP